MVSDIQELVNHKNTVVRQINAMQKELDHVDGLLVKYKLQLAEAMLQEHGDNLFKFVKVCFGATDATYDYLIDKECNVQPGDIVTIESKHGKPIDIRVEDVFYGQKKPGIEYKYAEYYG